MSLILCCDKAYDVNVFSVSFPLSVMWYDRDDTAVEHTSVVNDATALVDLLAEVSSSRYEEVSLLLPENIAKSRDSLHIDVDNVLGYECTYVVP